MTGMSRKINEDEIMKLVQAQLNRIESKVDKLDERLDSSEKVAIKQEHNLELHMKRSDLLEQSQTDLKEAVKPILKVYTVAWGICKIVAAIAVVVGILSGIARLAGLL